MRPLSASDLPRLQPLVAASEREGFRFVRRLYDEYIAGVACFDAPGECLLGIFAGDALIAVGGITRDPYVDSPDVGRVRHVYVLPSHRRLRVGAGLIGALEQRAESAFVLLRLRTDTLEATRFYEELGYVAVRDATATHMRAIRRNRQEAAT
jgi:GNAT superfamily N-acetyltransferase